MQGTDSFGRPLCARCPVQREIRYGAYQASTPLTWHGRRLLCQGYAHNGFRIELKANAECQTGDLLTSLAWATRRLTAEPGRFFHTLQVFLAALRKGLGMEAAELFLADPQAHYLILTAYDGVHREAFMEKPWFAWGEGFPGLVALGRHPLVTHALASDARYLRQKVKKLGYKTYVCYPLELPQGLIGVLNLANRDPDVDDQALLQALNLVGPVLAASLYMVLTRLGENGLRAIAQALRGGNDTEGLEVLLHQAALLSGAAGVRLALKDGRTLAQGRPTSACPYVKQCGVWQGRAQGVRTGLEPCPHTREGRPRYCLPLWSGAQVVGVQQFYFARLPQPPGQAVAALQWLERLGAELLWSEPAGSNAVPKLEIYTLGGLQVRRAGEPLSPKTFGRRQALTLFKLFLAHRGQTLSRDELCEHLWPGEDPEQTQGRLHVLVHDLRQALEPDPSQPQVVLREGDGYRFAPQIPYLLDVERFETLLRQAERQEGAAALELYRQALALYKGDFLADEPYADWAELERSYLRERAVGAWFRVAEIALALGQPREALESYRRILTLDPWREEAYVGLIETLLQTGQEAKARDLFTQYRTRMDREGLPVSDQMIQRMQISSGA
ncbi:BTAD domain-containing putative transcriptional regulator [Meiothermus cerbereus]|uniref:BTAD domain-containing putative transcriptional regulator n=1 Tax=Meiothermus cerbereus TaxID=65552 RepID=UPI002FD8B09D